MRLLQRAARTTQPRQFVPAASSPLAQGLIGLWTGSQREQNAVPGTDFRNVNAPNLDEGFWGSGFVGSTTSACYNIPDISAQLSTEATLLLLLQNGKDAAAGVSGFGLWGPGVAGDYDVYPYSDGKIYTSAFYSSMWCNGATPVVDVTTPHVFTAQARSGQQRAAQNGITLATAAVAGNPTYAANAAIGVSSTTFAYKGSIALVAIWARYLLDGEVNQIVANPWQLFRPRARRMYFAAPQSFALLGQACL